MTRTPIWMLAVALALGAVGEEAPATADAAYTNVLTVLDPHVITNTVTKTVVTTNVVVDTVVNPLVISATNLVTRTFKLVNASSEEVAERFNSTWTGDFGAVWKISKVAQPFPDANTVMVTAPQPVIDVCERVIADIDVEPQQVYIEARFVELSSTAMHSLGIDWSMLEAMKGSLSIGGGLDRRTIGNAVQSYDRTVTTSGDTTKYSLAGSTSAKKATFSETTGPGGVTTTQGNESSSNVSGRDGSVRFFTGTISFDDMYLILSALEGEYDVRTFSNPKIIVSSGRKAVVDMTTKYPNVNVAVKRTLNGNSDSVDLDMKMSAIPGEDKMMFAKEAFFSWGISLEVTPRVTKDGLIDVSIVPTISSKTGEVTAGSGGAETGGSYSSRYPIIDVQRLVTEFSMKSGMTAVIGGLSKTDEEQIDTGIPYLRNIPWIGDKLFGGKGRKKVQKEIIVFVSVGMAAPSSMAEDAGLPKNAVMGREYTSGVRKEPGDRASGMAGLTSLDLRSLEEQAADPSRTNRQERLESRFLTPFTKRH